MKTATIAVPAALYSEPGTVALMSVAETLVVANMVCVAPAVQCTDGNLRGITRCRENCCLARSIVKSGQVVPQAAMVAARWR